MSGLVTVFIRFGFRRVLFPRNCDDISTLVTTCVCKINQQQETKSRDANELAQGHGNVKLVMNFFLEQYSFQF